MGQQQSSPHHPSPNIPHHHVVAKASAYAPAPIPVKVEAPRPQPQPQPWTIQVTTRPPGGGGAARSVHSRSAKSTKSGRRHSRPVLNDVTLNDRRTRPLFSASPAQRRSPPLQPINTSVPADPDYYHRSRKTRPLFHSPTDDERETEGEYVPTRGQLVQAKAELDNAGRDSQLPIIPSKKPKVVPPPTNPATRTRPLFSSPPPARATAEVHVDSTPYPVASDSPPPKRKRRFSLLPSPPNVNRPQSLISIDNDRPPAPAPPPRRASAYAQLNTLPILKYDQPYEHEWPAKKPGRKRKLSFKRLFNPQLDLDHPPGELEHGHGVAEDRGGKKKSVRFIGQDAEGNVVDNDYYHRNGALRAEAVAGLPPSPLITPYHIPDRLLATKRASSRKGKAVPGGKSHPPGSFSSDRFFPDPGLDDFEDRYAARLARAEVRAARRARREERHRSLDTVVT